jgi:hypothetical protein
MSWRTVLWTIGIAVSFALHGLNDTFWRIAPQISLLTILAFGIVAATVFHVLLWANRQRTTQGELRALSANFGLLRRVGD